MKKFNVTVNGTTYEVEVEEVKSASSHVASAPRPAAASAPKPAPAPVAAAPKATAGAGEHSIDAPMPGKVIKLVASEGQAVKAGDVILVLEAMKMQNEIAADTDGVIKKFNVAAGQSVKAHESLAIIG